MAKKGAKIKQSIKVGKGKTGVRVSQKVKTGVRVSQKVKTGCKKA